MAAKLAKSLRREFGKLLRDGQNPSPIRSYWRWPQRNLAGNAIDFHTQVLGLSFQQAMQDITGFSEK